MADGRVVFDITGDNSQYKKTIDESQSIASKAFEGIAGVGKAAFAAVGTAVAGASAAVGALVKGAVDGYAEFEQLSGGVETLFGDTAADVMKNAEQAYKTAGLSANEYMETVTGFAAALTSSLGDYAWQSANYADLAVRSMADNANKMGSSMESIHNAYAGFAKGNFTMLDNLKLGYGGTKEEMERLLRDAEQIEGYVEGSLSLDSFADIVEAIDIIQTDMGIAGTTAAEAASTISGSMATMQGAWTNLVASLANGDADIGALVGQFVESVLVVVGNIMPAVKQAMAGVSTLIKEIAPVIATELPDLIATIFPDFLDASITIVEGLVDALPTLLGILLDAFPMVVEGIVGIVPDVINAFMEAMPQLIKVGLQLLLTLANAVIDNVDDLIPAVVACIQEIVLELTKPETLVKLIQAAFELVAAIGRGLINSIPILLETAGELLKTVLEPFKEAGQAFWEVGKNIVQGLIDGVKGWAQNAFNAINEFGENLLNGAKKILGIQSPSKEFKLIGRYIDEGLSDGIEQFEKLPLESAEDMLGGLLGGAMVMPTLEYTHADPSAEGLEAITRAVQANGIEDPTSGVTAVLEVDGQRFGTLFLPYFDMARQRRGVDVMEGTSWT